jgi:AcrR family transcriptional regulator
VNPRATDDDLTAKARIRNTALDLFSRYGEDRVSLRAIAAEAGVTLGLVQHHFKTKAGLRDAVDRLAVDYFSSALADVTTDGSPARRRGRARRGNASDAARQPARGELCPPGRCRPMQPSRDCTYAWNESLRSYQLQIFVFTMSI